MAYRLSVIGLVALAFCASLWVSRHIFERLPHLEDEVAYLYQARIFARGEIVMDTPPLRTAFWQPFIVDYNGNRFSKYTPGWSLMLSLGVWLGTPWIINAWLSALGGALVWRFTREVYDQHTARFALILMVSSPMLLLLNGSLMGHSWALVCTWGFIYSFWRMTRSHQAIRWGMIGGLWLGGLIVNRPLTAIGISAPFVVISAVVCVRALLHRNKQLLWASIALATVALCVALLIPLYRWVATGNPWLNPYTLVWSYDRVGFGEAFGRNGHTLGKGIRHLREDLSVSMADAFGWQWGQFDVMDKIHLLAESGSYPDIGMSWVLLPFGLAWLVWGASNRQRGWAIVLASVIVSLLGVHVAYWIGSQRYSTRYYMEALPAFAILSALGLAFLRQHLGNRIVFPFLGAVLAFTLFSYTLPRLKILHGFNGVSLQKLEVLEPYRAMDAPILVIVMGDAISWRAGGTYMVMTSPYLDSEIVLARDKSNGLFRDDLRRLFADRVIVWMVGNGDDVTLLGAQPPQAE